MIIWKFPLTMSRTNLQIPKSAEVVHVGEEEGGICLWILLDPEAINVQRTFHAYPTGINVAGIFVGTVQIGLIIEGSAFPFVWHVFEEIK